MAAVLCSGCVREDVVVSGGQLALVVRDFADEPAMESAELEDVTLTPDSEVELRSGGVFSSSKPTKLSTLIWACRETRRRSEGELTCELGGSAVIDRRTDWASTVGIWAGATVATVAIGLLVGFVVSADESAMSP